MSLLQALLIKPVTPLAKRRPTLSAEEKAVKLKRKRETAKIKRHEERVIRMEQQRQTELSQRSKDAQIAKSGPLVALLRDPSGIKTRYGLIRLMMRAAVQIEKLQKGR